MNTLTRGLDMMKQSGIDAQYGKNETETDIVVTIKIPKKERTGFNACSTK